MKQLYFIRHAVSEFNKANRWSGRTTDVPLAPEGHTQAKLAGLLAKEKGLAFDVIVSSPMKRAHETAKIFASEIGYPHDNIITHDLLVERDFGKLEGKRELVSATRYVLNEAAIDRYKGVETLADLHARAQAALDYLHELPHEVILVVGHGAHGRALRRVIKSEPIHIRGKSYANAELVRLI